MTMIGGTLVPQTRCDIGLAIRRRSADDAPPTIVMVAAPSDLGRSESAGRACRGTMIAERPR